MKKWNIISEYNPKALVVEQILKNRKVENISEYLSPPSTQVFFERLGKDLKKAFMEAKKLVEKNMNEGKTIVIYGDYDVDGVSSTSILYNTIKKELSYEKVLYFIPSRFEHGYGLSEKALKDFQDGRKEENYLFITVDTGITAEKEIEMLKNLGHEVIIIDHHQKPDKLPPADVIIWYEELVASGLAWLFSKFLGSKDKRNIELAALATVTDVAPLLGFNRTIVKAGLEALNADPLPGIREIIKAAGRAGGEITVYDLGWVIGPRLNASGRLVDAKKSLSLFIEDDPEKIAQNAQELNLLNEDRQGKTLDMYDLAENFDKGALPKIIFSESADYHEGIIGLVAARLAQKYFRPAIVVSLADGMGKGSVRSIKGFDITEFLRKFDDLFVSLGGHPMAAGFSIEQKNLPELKKRISEEAEKSLSEKLLIPEILIDLEIPAEIITPALLAELENMKPFGMGNEEPVFAARNLGVSEISLMGKDNQHARIKFYKDSKYFKGVLFDGAREAEKLKFGDKVDAAFYLKKNEYNGAVYVDLVIKDLKKME